MSQDLKILQVDLNEEMKEEAIQISTEAVSKFKVDRDIAEAIKVHFDKKFGAAWHCIVGRGFGSFITHETNRFIFFAVGERSILLWKNGIASD